MSIMIGGLPPRNSRNGAKAAKWCAAQAYNVEAAAKDPNTPIPIMLDIAANATGRIITFLAANKGADESVVREIYGNLPTDATQIRLASNPATPSDILLSVGQSRQAKARRSATKHPNAPAELLETRLAMNFLQEYLQWDATAAKKIRGEVRHHDYPEQRIAMLHGNLPIQTFAANLPYVAQNDDMRSFYKARGKELVSYLNHEFSLSLDYKHPYGVARALRKYFPIV